MKLNSSKTRLVEDLLEYEGTETWAGPNTWDHFVSKLKEAELNQADIVTELFTD